MKTTSIVALDIGGTKINYGLLRAGKVETNHVVEFCAHESEQTILHFIIECIDKVLSDDTKAIAIGVPSIVNIEQGIVLDAVNIPAWQEAHLKADLEQHYSKDVYINNDVNCFVAGEFSSGVGQGSKDVVGICLGTGFGSGFILNNQLHAGRNCCAGEVGGIAYLSGTIDDYCSGSFFINHYQESGDSLAQKALSGEQYAIDIFDEFGKHLAKAISYLLFIIDPQLIVIGGSVSKSFELFIDSVWKNLEKFPYESVVKNLRIEKSTLSNAPLLGVAHLYQQSCSQ